jgi:hypothetical protein
MDADGDVLGLLFIGFVGGLYLIWQGFKLHRQRKLMRDTPTSTVQSASLGPVEVKGVVEAFADGVTAPVTGTEAVFVEYEAEYYDDTGDSKGWRTLVEDVDAVPFHLRDETGAVRVVLDASVETDISVGNTTQEVVRPGEQEPDAVAAFIERHPDVPDHGDSSWFGSDKIHEKRRYTERILRPGDDVYLFGTAESAEDEALVIRAGDRDMFFVSDRTEQALVDDRRWALLWRVPVGAALSAVCGGTVLWLFGIL